MVKRQSGREEGHHLSESSSAKILASSGAKESSQAKVDENVVDKQRYGHFQW